jgi:hypothetical protein
MREELIVSGRLNYKIDPMLHIWGWEIPLYLFLGGLAAGVLFFAAFYYLQGKEKEYPCGREAGPAVHPRPPGARPHRPFHRPQPQALLLAAVHHHQAAVAHVLGRLDPHGRDPHRVHLVGHLPAGSCFPKWDWKYSLALPAGSLFHGKAPRRWPGSWWCFR